MSDRITCNPEVERCVHPTSGLPTAHHNITRSKWPKAHQNTLGLLSEFASICIRLLTYHGQAGSNPKVRFADHPEAKAPPTLGSSAIRPSAAVRVRDCVHQIDVSHQHRNEKVLRANPELAGLTIAFRTERRPTSQYPCPSSSRTLPRNMRYTKTK
jgi:hypothetical protein